LIELLVVIAIIGILAALLLPVLDQGKSRAKRIQCVSDLKETGLAFHVFENDHNGKLPTQVSTNDSGSLELVDAGFQVHGEFYFSFRHFLTLAGALTTPKPLACPADGGRWPGTNFNQFSNSNLSYAIGLAPNADIPGAILAADRNFPSCRYHPPVSQTMGHIGSRNDVLPPYWTTGLHERKGNVLFADGHVEESYDAIFLSECSVSEYLVYPDVKVSIGSSSTARPISMPMPNNPPSPAASAGVDRMSSPVDKIPSPPVLGKQNSPNNAGSAMAARSVQSNSTSLNIARDSFANGPMGDQAVEMPKTNLVGVVEISTNTTTKTDDNLSGKSSVDVGFVKLPRNIFGWGYLLLLLLFLLWLSFKLRREWKRLQQRSQEYSAGKIEKHNPNEM